MKQSWKSSGNKMNYVLSNHAAEKIKRRKIPIDFIDSVLNDPQQILENDGFLTYQSKIEKDNKEYLLRIFVNPYVNPNLIITVYLTNKISKYWK